MSKILIEKIRRARELGVEAGGFKFTVRRPTDLEIAGMSEMTQSEILRRFVIGWDGVKEVDLVPGGTGDMVPFESELFMEWIADRPALWGPLAQAAVSSYAAHRQKLEDEAKNSSPG
jgi:hypothetical protein